MQNILITLAFDGTHYKGYQVQGTKPTICAAVQNAIEQVYGEKYDIKGCSRTDSGVHASGYCISFFAPKNKVAINKLPLALNAKLKSDIRVLSAAFVENDFHARYSAKSKTYVYTIRNSHMESPFTCAFEHKVSKHLDEKRMHAAAQYFVGKHDFLAFAGKKLKKGITVRTVNFAKVERDGEVIRFTVNADGFLFNMVRIMAGTLIRVGTGDMEAAAVTQVIEGKNRKAAGETAPAKGLCLTEVIY